MSGAEGASTPLSPEELGITIVEPDSPEPALPGVDAAIEHSDSELRDQAFLAYESLEDGERELIDAEAARMFDGVNDSGISAETKSALGFASMNVKASHESGSAEDIKLAKDDLRQISRVARDELRIDGITTNEQRSRHLALMRARGHHPDFHTGITVAPTDAEIMSRFADVFGDLLSPTPPASPTTPPPPTPTPPTAPPPPTPPTSPSPPAASGMWGDTAPEHNAELDANSTYQRMSQHLENMQKEYTEISAKYQLASRRERRKLKEAVEDAQYAVDFAQSELLSFVNPVRADGTKRYDDDELSHALALRDWLRRERRQENDDGTEELSLNEKAFQHEIEHLLSPEKKSRWKRVGKVAAVAGVSALAGPAAAGLIGFSYSAYKGYGIGQRFGRKVYLNKLSGQEGWFANSERQNIDPSEFAGMSQKEIRMHVIQDTFEGTLKNARKTDIAKAGIVTTSGFVGLVGFGVGGGVIGGTLGTIGERVMNGDFSPDRMKNAYDWLRNDSLGWVSDKFFEAAEASEPIEVETSSSATEVGDGLAESEPETSESGDANDTESGSEAEESDEPAESGQRKVGEGLADPAEAPEAQAGDRAGEVTVEGMDSVDGAVAETPTEPVDISQQLDKPDGYIEKGPDGYKVTADTGPETNSIWRAAEAILNDRLEEPPTDEQISQLTNHLIEEVPTFGPDNHIDVGQVMQISGDKLNEVMGLEAPDTAPSTPEVGSGLVDPADADVPAPEPEVEPETADESEDSSVGAESGESGEGRGVGAGLADAAEVGANGLTEQFQQQADQIVDSLQQRLRELSISNVEAQVAQYTQYVEEQLQKLQNQLLDQTDFDRLINSRTESIIEQLSQKIQ